MTNDQALIKKNQGRVNGRKRKQAAGSTEKKRPTTSGHAGKTNKEKNSLVKVIVLEDVGKWVTPNSAQIFFIDEQASFPAIDFEINTMQPGPYQWSWKIVWPAAVSGLKESSKRGKILKTFSKEGKFEKNEKCWHVDLGDVVGGTLTVTVVAEKETFKRSVYIRAKNPSETQVKNLLTTIENVKGFEKLLAQESKFKNFINADNEPVVAFDGGYGLTQMTTPAPTFVQVWNWKENIQGGASLYKSKQVTAKNYLSKDHRTYTDEQLKLETWSRWNGGAYHVWDEAKRVWTRNTTIMADSATGNIGWDMTKDENKGKTEAELHKRDKDEYKAPPATRLWKYSGVCYADHLNNE
jgi:hypothetical protein